MIIGTSDRARYAHLVLLAAVLVEPGLAHAQVIDACIDASEKALAQRKAGKLIDERASLSRCASSACPEAINTSCRQRLADVSRAIPRIVFVVKDAAGHDLWAAKLAIDGESYADHLDGSAIELDPGKHDFRFEVAGQEPIERQFLLSENEQDRRETIVIGGAATVPATGTEIRAAAIGAGAAPAADQPPSHQTAPAPWRTIGLVVGSVGVAVVIAGGAFGVLSIDAHTAYERDCGSNIGAPPGACNAQGVAGEKDAATKGTLATALLLGGAVLGGVGAVAYFLGPAGQRGVGVGVSPAGVALRTQF
jgi:hypothetical protein